MIWNMIKGELIETYDHPYLYFSADIKNNPKIDQAELEAAVVAERYTRETHQLGNAGGFVTKFRHAYEVQK